MPRLTTTIVTAFVFLLPAFLMAGPATGEEPIADHPRVQDAIRLIEAWIEGQQRRHDLPGIAVGLVHDQELIWSRGFGYADLATRRPMTPETPFRVASITKTFTAAAIMQLQEQGYLTLEDPVHEHLSWMPVCDACDEPVRIWHLLSHSSGMQRETPGRGEGASRDLHEIPGLLTGEALLLMPGTRLKYSNLAVVIAGLLVEERMGMSHAEYLQQRIFEPLGMSSSRLMSGDEVPEGLATPYGRSGKDPRPVLQQITGSSIQPSGGLVSTVHDLAKWASVQFRTDAAHQSQVLTARSIREMHRPRFLNSNWQRGFGVGWSMQRSGDIIYHGHGGSLPGYSSSLMLLPEKKLGAIVLVNSAGGNAGAIATFMLGTMSKAIDAATPRPEPADADELARFEGLYEDLWGNQYRIMVLGGQLMRINQEADDPLAAAARLERVSDLNFISNMPAGVHNWGVGEPVEFLADDAGAITAVIFESGSRLARRVAD